MAVAPLGARISPDVIVESPRQVLKRQLARLAELIALLRAGNPRFARLWADGAVAAHRGDRKTIAHPVVGPVMVDCDVLTDGDAELKIVIMTAVPGSPDETKLRLATVAGITGEVAPTS